MRYAAFLRGMNVGGHRLTNQVLCAHIEALGFSDVSAFLASGNVVFEAGRKKDVARCIAQGLESALGYRVPTILRSGAEVVAVAERELFSPALLKSRGKEHVWFLADPPSAAARQAVLALASDDDLLAVVGHELHWLPRGSVLDSKLTIAQVERLVGTATARTKNTVARLAKKHFSA